MIQRLSWNVFAISHFWYRLVSKNETDENLFPNENGQIGDIYDSVENDERIISKRHLLSPKMGDLRMEIDDDEESQQNHYIYDQNQDDDEVSQHKDNIYGQNEDIDDYFNNVNENVEQVIWKKDTLLDRFYSNTGWTRYSI